MILAREAMLCGRDQFLSSFKTQHAILEDESCNQTSKWLRLSRFIIARGDRGNKFRPYLMLHMISGPYKKLQQISSGMTEAINEIGPDRYKKKS